MSLNAPCTSLSQSLLLFHAAHFLILSYSSSSDEHPAAMHTGQGGAPDPLPAWGVMLVACLVLLVARGRQGEQLNSHLFPHVFTSPAGGEGREGDKRRRKDGLEGGGALGSVGTCLSLTCARKESFKSHWLQETRRPLSAGCHRAVSRRAIDSLSTTPPHLAPLTPCPR